MADKVTLTLAHPLSAEYAPRMRLEAKEYALGQKVELAPDDARALINAGYATVDPEDRQAVARALGGPAAEGEPRTAGGAVGGAGGEQPRSSAPGGKSG